MIFKERPKGPNNFLKIKAGESIKGILRGEIFDYSQHWNTGKSEPCEGEGCVLCGEGLKKSFRFRCNILTKEVNPEYGEKYVCKIFEQGGVTYDFLKSLAEDFDLEKTVLKISRVGEKMQTKYTIVPLPGVVDDTKFKDIPLHDLTKFEKEEAHDQGSEDSIPF
jgi:hypothetical protein